MTQAGWRGLFGLYAVPGFLGTVGFRLEFRDRPEDHPALNATEFAFLGNGEPALRRQAEVRSPTPWGMVLRNPALGWLAASSCDEKRRPIFSLALTIDYWRA